MLADVMDQIGKHGIGERTEGLLEDGEAMMINRWVDGWMNEFRSELSYVNVDLAERSKDSTSSALTQKYHGNKRASSGNSREQANRCERPKYM